MTTTLRSKVEVQLGWTWRDRIGPFVVTDDTRLVAVETVATSRPASERGQRLVDALSDAPPAKLVPVTVTRPPRASGSPTCVSAA